MNAEVNTITTRSEAIMQKRAAWANMGEAIYKAELQLQAITQAALLNISYPTKPDELPVAEKRLKELKAQQKAVESKRKEVTSPLDGKVSILMQSEKSFTAPIKQLEDAIIKVKKEDADRRKRDQEKADEQKRIIEYLLQRHADVDAVFKAKINSKVSKAYEYALGEGNISLADLESFLQKAAGRLTEMDFVPLPVELRLVYISQEDYIKLVDEYYRFDPHTYLIEYITALEKQFSDYEVALKNKADALTLAKQQNEEKQQTIEEEKNNVIAAATLFSAAADLPADVGPTGVKDLKHEYCVDMPETIDSAVKILAAFTANLNLCLPKLRVNKWFSFTPGQAAGALAKVKNDDNAFSPSGIIFKKVDKL